MHCFASIPDLRRTEIFFELERVRRKSDQYDAHQPSRVHQEKLKIMQKRTINAPKIAILRILDAVNV